MNSEIDDVEIFWHSRKGWVIRAPFRVPDSSLLKMCRAAVGQYENHLLKMPDGPHKKRLSQIIRLLDMMQVTQEIRSQVSPHN